MNGNGPSPSHRTLAAAVACLAVLLAAPTGAVATGAETAQTDPRVTVSNVTLDPGETGTVRVALSAAPDGLAGYELTLELAEGSVATVDAARYPGTFQLTSDPQVGPDGRTVTVEAAVTDVAPGAGNVTLATVNVTGAGDGSTAVRVTDVRIDADDGSRVDPSVDRGTVTVGTGSAAADTPSPGTGDGPATDRTRTTRAEPAADRPTGAAGTESGTTAGSGPGFGAVAAVLAFVAAAALRARD